MQGTASLHLHLLLLVIVISIITTLVISAPLQLVTESDENGYLTEDNGYLLTDDELSSDSNYGKAWIQLTKPGGDYGGKAAGRRKNNRNGVRLAYDKWPGGQIPYVMSKRYTQRERDIIQRAMNAYREKTCINFVRRNAERDYLFIGKIDGCFSDVGRAGGRQELSLHDGCVEYDTAIHELMHAVGFWHEHERWDRSNYIDIKWENIDRKAYDQFGKVNLFESDYYNETYDYFSIMHYDSKSFSKNGQNTITARNSGMTRIIGRVKDFSPVDLRKINKMYKCKNTDPPPAQTSWVQPPRSNGNGVGTRVISRKCEDAATLCWRWVDRCRSPFFADVMKEFCALTCNYCSKSSPSTPSAPAGSQWSAWNGR